MRGSRAALEQRHFIESADVKRGQCRYTIDSTPFKIALADALADAQADQARSQANQASARSREARLAPLVKEATLVPEGRLVGKGEAST